MSLTLRNVKGSPLTYTEMDNNLLYLEGLGATGSISVDDLNVGGELTVSGTSSLNDVVIGSGKKILFASDGVDKTASLSVNYLSFNDDISTKLLTSNTLDYAGITKRVSSSNITSGTSSVINLEVYNDILGSISGIYIKTNQSGPKQAERHEVMLSSSDGRNSNEIILTPTNLSLTNIPAFDDDTDADNGGLITGDVYQTTGLGASPLDVAGILMIKQ